MDFLKIVVRCPTHAARFTSFLIFSFLSPHAALPEAPLQAR